jgi:SAM-dependent methyltransferase
MADFNPEVFFDIHCDLPREGPGSNASTRRAFEMVSDLPESPRILDVGCGPGMQTLELASVSGGHITAVDNHQPFLDQLAESARAEGLADRIEIINASMFDLPFDDESFDLIWCEGAIFIMGVAEGLKQWKRFLKPGGVIAFTESAWIRPDQPREVRDFWQIYPAITDIAGHQAIIREAGYEPIGHFILPASDWWDHYYGPMEKRMPMLRAKYAGNESAQPTLDFADLEMDIHRRFSDYYSYVFYIMRKAVEV